MISISILFEGDPLETCTLKTLVDKLKSRSWVRIRLELVNTRNVYAREPLVSIFESIFKETMQKTSPEKNISYFFHPAGELKLPERVKKNTIYSIDLIVIDRNIQFAHQFVETLGEHLNDPYRNFKMEKKPVPEHRNLDVLLGELDKDCPTRHELCLEFMTNFGFHPKIKNRPWLILETDFFVTFSARIYKIFGIDLKFGKNDLQDLIILPYYWHYENRLKHRTKSRPGLKCINGTIGPLYIKGNIKKILPLVALCSELHVGGSLPYGQGFYKIRKHRPYFDNLIVDDHWLSRSVSEIESKNDLNDDQVTESLLDSNGLIQTIRGKIANQDFEPGIAKSFLVSKKQGGHRQIVTLCPQDLLIHKLLVSLLQPVMNKMFENSSIGFRPGKSKEQVKQIITQACRQGYGYVLETDIEAFFDHINWAVLFEKLKQVLPESDRLTMDLIKKVVKTDIECNHKRIRRSQGLLQGSPLSPLFSNLYLDAFDEELEACGLKHVRYGDDLIVFLKTEDEGQAVRSTMEQILAPLGLSLKNEKTNICSLDLGFSFLGLQLGYTLEEEILETAAFRKPLFIRPIYAFVGVDGHCIVIRKENKIIGSFPMSRVSELIIMGTNTISTILLTRCSHEKIPISFCSPSGYHMNTVFADTQAGFERLYQHTKKFNSLENDARINIASLIIQAKISNYMSWIKKRYKKDAGTMSTSLKKIINSLVKAKTVDELRGYEGKAASILFSYINQIVNQAHPGFKSFKRVKQKKADYYNSLLDFAYFLLFTRVNILVRSKGLNPFLGFLHSHKNHYESLVYDLMEPFRYRMDRMVVKVINRKTIRENDFEMTCRYGKKNGYRLTKQGVGRFIEAFETELHTCFKGDGASLLQVLTAQVSLVYQWSREDCRLLFFTKT